METTFGRCADELIELAYQNLSDVRVLRHEFSIERWRIDLTGRFGNYLVHVSEISAVDWRKYAYYVRYAQRLLREPLLLDNRIVIGFDNSPDVYAIDMKYPDNPQAHRHEKVPHRHEADKSELVLTDEMTFEKFIDWLQTNLQ